MNGPGPLLFSGSHSRSNARVLIKRWTLDLAKSEFISEAMVVVRAGQGLYFCTECASFKRGWLRFYRRHGDRFRVATWVCSDSSMIMFVDSSLPYTLEKRMSAVWWPAVSALTTFGPRST